MNYSRLTQCSEVADGVIVSVSWARSPVDFALQALGVYSGSETQSTRCYAHACCLAVNDLAVGDSSAEWYKSSMFAHEQRHTWALAIGTMLIND